MKTLQRSALIPYRAGEVYEIVNDVARYPEFLPWCKSASVQADQPGIVVATLIFEAMGLRLRLTTANALQPGRSIRLGQVEGPFGQFDGLWRFSDVGAGQGCRVELHLRFALRHGGRLLAIASSGRIASAADAAMDAFCRRVHELLDGQAQAGTILADAG